MNFQITQGTGTTIATDVGGGSENYQKIKLIDATPGSTAGTGIASNPFWITGSITSNIGTTGGLALDTSVNGILLQQGSITSGQFGPLMMGAVTTAPPSYATGQTSPLSLTPSGSLRVELENFPTTFNNNLVTVSGAPIVLGPNVMANSLPVTIASNQTPFPPTPAVDVPVTGTLSSLFDSVVINCHGLSTLGWTTSGTWSGTMQMELEYGDGVWYQVEVIDTNVSGGNKPFVVTSWTESLNNDPWITNIAGAVQARIRFTIYNSGTANIVFNGSVGNNATRVYNLNQSMFVTQSWIRDGAGTALTSTTFGAQHALDVNIAGGVTIDVNLDHTTDNVLVYGNDGTTDRKIKTDASGNVETVITNATLAVTQSGVWTVGRTWTLASGTDSVASVQSGTWSVRNQDGSGNNITSQANGVQRALDVGIDVAGVQIDPRQIRALTVADVVSAAQSGTWNINNITGTVSLPTGASTEATLSTRLADATFTARINTLGQKTMANSTPVVLASDQSVIPVSQSGTWNINNISGTISLPSGAATEATLSTRLADATFTGRINTLGQKTMANSTPIVISSDQSAIPVSQSGTWNLNNISGTVSLPTGASTSANQTNGSQKTQVVDGSGNVIGSTSNALDENVKSWLGSTAPTVGQKTMANSVPVVVSSDQTSFKTLLDIAASGTINALNGAVTGTINGVGSCVFELTGTFVATLVAEGSIDNTNWVNLTIFPATGPSVSAGVTTTGYYRIPSIGAYTQIRIRASLYTSGTATVTMNFAEGVAAPQLFSPNAINVKVDALSSKEAQASNNQAFCVAAGAYNITPANADQASVYIKNGSGSGKTLILQQIIVTLNATSGGTAASDLLVKVFANPTSSANGTAATINTTSIGSGVSSAMTAFTTPTVSANGTLLYTFSAGNANPSIPQDLTAFRVAANNNILVTVNSGVNNTTTNIIVVWSEE